MKKPDTYICQDSGLTCWWVDQYYKKEEDIAALKKEIERLKEMVLFYQDLCKANNWPVPLKKEE